MHRGFSLSGTVLLLAFFAMARKRVKAAAGGGPLGRLGCGRPQRSGLGLQFVPRHGAGLLLGVLLAALAALTALTTHISPAAHGASTVCARRRRRAAGRLGMVTARSVAPLAAVRSMAERETATGARRVGGADVSPSSDAGDMGPIGGIVGRSSENALPVPPRVGCWAVQQKS